MKIYDGHIHLGMPGDPKEEFIRSREAASLNGSMVISPAPGCAGSNGRPMSWRERLDTILEWRDCVPDLIPFFWVDPTEKDIDQQIDTAVKHGIAGFKAICTHYSPEADVPMRAWRRMAEAGKPLLFHTGILIGPGCSEYCRPLYYERLLTIPGLRFCMAHVSWPWCDECIALFTKWNNCTLQGSTTAQLYLDTTPGTPGVYRRELLAHLYGSGLPVADKLIFGTDLRNRYDTAKSLTYVQRDCAILDELMVAPKAQENYFSGNLLAFVGRDIGTE